MARGTLAIQNAKIYVSPDTPPIENGTIVIQDGKIAAVGADIPVPSDAQIIPCDHCVVTAGFWNAHVHFTERKWARRIGSLRPSSTRSSPTCLPAGDSPPSSMSARTCATRFRSAAASKSGELSGPKIYTAGSAQYPPNGIPFYLKGTTPWFILKLMPQPATPEEAAKVEERNIAEGADVLKLFTGSWVAHGKVLPMPEANARAAVEVAHAMANSPSLIPPISRACTVAMNSGVDVLAHAAERDRRSRRQAVANHGRPAHGDGPDAEDVCDDGVEEPRYLDPIYAEVRQFHADGGQLIFGTDVGYMTDYTTEDEFHALEQSGLNAMDILRMLTTAPAERFGVTDRKGTIAVGKLADLVVLRADPASDVANFSKVQTTVRSGRMIYGADPPARHKSALRICPGSAQTLRPKRESLQPISIADQGKREARLQRMPVGDVSDQLG